MGAAIVIIMWICFTFLMSLAEEVNALAFFYCSSIIFYLTYHINALKNINIHLTLQVTILFLTIPSFIFWYIFIEYNYFLRIKPIPYVFVVFTMFTYFYILMYIFFESKHLLP